MDAKAYFLGAVAAAALPFAASHGQELKTKTPVVDEAFGLAVRTLRDNTENKLIKAGGGYGGEWTRDCAINSWNAANLLEPDAAEYSLWSVTMNDRGLIGHQYWDKIIWVLGAYDYYLTTGDKDFLQQAYACSANTMKELEDSQFNKEYGLFKGPSVFNDGIAGYDEPIYDPSVGSTFVLDHVGSHSIECLSTNAVYYEAYVLLARMAALCGDTGKVAGYEQKARDLKASIRRNLFDAGRGRLNYLIDQNGKVHPQQEGLGLSFAILFGIVDAQEARKIVDQAYVSPHGLPSIYPHFKRFSDEKPGRHNFIIWPFVNAFWAEACLRSGRGDLFERELLNLADLAMNEGSGNFYEIYNAQTGKVDGGWQIGQHRVSQPRQTWSATGYLRMVFRGLFGMEFSPQGMRLNPDFPALKKLGFSELSGLPYRNGTVDIRFTGEGDKLAETLVDGKKSVPRAIVPANLTGPTTIEYRFQR